MSGVTVHTRIASTSDASIPRCSSAFLPLLPPYRRLLSPAADVPLQDAVALDDPLVVGVHHLFQILIREHSWRRVAAERSYFRFVQCFSLSRSDSDTEYTTTNRETFRLGVACRAGLFLGPESQGHRTSRSFVVQFQILRFHFSDDLKEQQT